VYPKNHFKINFDQNEIYGVNKYSDGDVYEGQFQNNKKNGYGVYKYSSGNIYEGEMKDDKKHGFG
jgi:hypothetical protein